MFPTLLQIHRDIQPAEFRSDVKYCTQLCKNIANIEDPEYTHDELERERFRNEVELFMAWYLFSDSVKWKIKEQYLSDPEYTNEFTIYRDLEQYVTSKYNAPILPVASCNDRIAHYTFWVKMSDDIDNRIEGYLASWLSQPISREARRHMTDKNMEARALINQKRREYSVPLMSLLKFRKSARWLLACGVCSAIGGRESKSPLVLLRVEPSICKIIMNYL